MIDRASPVADHISGQLGWRVRFAWRSPFPRRCWIGLRPQPDPRRSGIRFESRGTLVVRGSLAIPPRETSTNQVAVEVPTIGQHDIGDNPPVAVVTSLMNSNHLPEGDLRPRRLGSSTDDLADLGAIDPGEVDSNRGPVDEHRDRVVVRHTDDLVGGFIRVVGAPRCEAKKHRPECGSNGPHRRHPVCTTTQAWHEAGHSFRLARDRSPRTRESTR
jgi:hypothetical protein